MNRNITEDINKSIAFFNNYNVSDIINDETFKSKYKIVHKKALGYLITISEIEKQNQKTNLYTEQALFYLHESVSDILQSIFLWINGAYKGASLLLRSSIENFIKGNVGIYDATVYTEKSVYKIFDKIKSYPQFQVILSRDSIENELHNLYVEFCKSTHTATIAQMDRMGALNVLPKYEESKSSEYSNNLEKLIDVFLGFFLANHKNIIDAMYMNNSDIFYEVISQNITRQIVHA